MLCICRIVRFGSLPDQHIVKGPRQLSHLPFGQIASDVPDAPQQLRGDIWSILGRKQGSALDGGDVSMSKERTLAGCVSATLGTM